MIVTLARWGIFSPSSSVWCLERSVVIQYKTLGWIVAGMNRRRSSERAMNWLGGLLLGFLALFAFAEMLRSG
jgi:hypothetical protein